MIADALLESMARAPLVAAIIEDLAEEKRIRSRSPGVPPVKICGQFLLHGFEQIDGNDRLVITGVTASPVIELAEVESVFQDIGERAIGQRDIAMILPEVSCRDLVRIPNSRSSRCKAGSEPSSR